MSLIMDKGYTNSYRPVNTKPYSTANNSKPHNSAMTFQDWLKAQIDELGSNPTGLARMAEGLNQPTVQRVLSGENSNPRLDTVVKIVTAVARMRDEQGKPRVTYALVRPADMLTEKVVGSGSADLDDEQTAPAHELLSHSGPPKPLLTDEEEGVIRLLRQLPPMQREFFLGLGDDRLAPAACWSFRKKPKRQLF